MPVAKVTAGYPPQVFQVARGAGVLTSVATDLPAYYGVRDQDSIDRFDSSLPRYTGDMYAEVFDGIDIATATHLVSFGGTPNSEPLNLSFSQGLIVRSHNANTLNVSYTAS